MRYLHLLVAVLLAAPLAAQDLPAPGDHRQAVERATGLYSEAMTAVSASIEAIQADDSLMLELAVRQYRRVMTYLTVWHGRACWKADYEGANVAYPQQAVMGETLIMWGVAREPHNRNRRRSSASNIGPVSTGPRPDVGRDESRNAEQMYPMRRVYEPRAIDCRRDHEIMNAREVQEGPEG